MMGCNCWTSGPECCVRRSSYPYWVVDYRESPKSIAARVIYESYRDREITAEQALKALKDLG